MDDGSDICPLVVGGRASRRSQRSSNRFPFAMRRWRIQRAVGSRRFRVGATPPHHPSACSPQPRANTPTLAAPVDPGNVPRRWPRTRQRQVVRRSQGILGTRLDPPRPPETGNPAHTAGALSS
jgi:hypothetical protein